MSEQKPYSIFIVAIDGLAATGKGVIGQRLATAFDFAYLDTGKLYRQVALDYHQIRNAPESPDHPQVINATTKPPELINSDLAAQVSNTIKLSSDSRLYNPEVALLAAKLAKLPEVRKNLLAFQQQFCRNPVTVNGEKKSGAILDGRDIGTVIAPRAQVKLFFTAAVNVRAKRRHKEALARGQASNLQQVITDLQNRDHNDTNRSIAPCLPAEDAVVIDNSNLTEDSVFEHCQSVISQALQTQTTAS